MYSSNLELIVIMNYDRGEVYVTHIDFSKYEDIQQFFDELNEKHELNISESNSYWMSAKELQIIHF